MATKTRIPGLGPIDDRRLAACLAGVGLFYVFLQNGTDFSREATHQTLLRNITALMVDDGFYYLQIAKNLANGLGSSFDGINPTNGYHPLWLWNLVPLFWLGAGKNTVVLIAMGLQSFYFAISIYYLFLTARLYFTGYAASLAAMGWIAVQSSYWMVFSGMEYGLHAMLLAIILYYFLSRLRGETDRASTGTFFLLGVLCGTCILTRLDSALLVPSIGLFLWLRTKKTRGAIPAGRHVLAFALVPALVSVAYLWLNLVAFDLAVPVSGLLKRDWSVALLEADPVYQHQGWLGAKLAYLFWPVTHMRRAFWLPLTVGAFGIPILWLVWRRFKPAAFASLGKFLDNSLPFVWFAPAQYLLFVSVYHGGFSFQPWHFVMPLFFAVICCAALIETIVKVLVPAGSGDRRLGLGVALALAVWCAAPLYGLRSVWHWKDRQRAFYRTEPFQPGARWVSENLPADAMIGAWNAGSLAFFSERTVINLDGLVNSRQYYESDRFDLCRYLAENKIEYLADVFERDNELAFLHRTYAPQTDLSPCFSNWTRIWVGPAYPGTNRHFEVYRLTGGTFD